MSLAIRRNTFAVYGDTARTAKVLSLKFFVLYGILHIYNYCIVGIEGANIKVLCNLDKLLILFSGKCHKPGCVENCSIAKYKVIGCCVLIHSQCTNKHIFVWKSSEMLTSRTNNKLFQNNLLFASAIILSGQSYYKIADFANVLGLSVSSSSSFHCYQRHYICPGIEVFFNAEQVNRHINMYHNVFILHLYLHQIGQTPIHLSW